MLDNQEVAGQRRQWPDLRCPEYQSQERPWSVAASRATMVGAWTSCWTGRSSTSYRMSGCRPRSGDRLATASGLKVRRVGGHQSREPRCLLIRYPCFSTSAADHTKIWSRSHIITRSICTSRTALEAGPSTYSYGDSGKAIATLPDESYQVQECTLFHPTFCTAAEAHLSLRRNQS